MKEKIIKIIITAFLASLVFAGAVLAGNSIPETEAPVQDIVENTDEEIINNEEIANVYFFGRESCGHCQAEKEFFKEYLVSEPNVSVTYYDVVEDPEARKLFDALVKDNNLAKIVPYTLVGGEIINGFDTEETTGKKIIEIIESTKGGYNYTLKDYINSKEIIEEYSDDTVVVPDEGVRGTEGFEFTLPFSDKVINVENLSLSSLALILGLVDGFNPCALWVLMTFLLILMQIGNRKKMFYVAGLFIFAESIMYYFILNVWYKTWDFIALDEIITPLVGALAVASGILFLNKYRKTKDKFTCDVTSIEKQTSIEKKIQKLISSPMTVPTILGIIGVALSVNVIEFACSVGIPQAFTKILELNVLDFWVRQWYLALYIFAYMVDDFIVFSLALYGFDKLHTSEKYSKLSMLVGGVLMIILGAILLLNPDILMF